MHSCCTSVVCLFVCLFVCLYMLCTLLYGCVHTIFTRSHFCSATVLDSFSLPEGAEKWEETNQYFECIVAHPLKCSQYSGTTMVGYSCPGGTTWTAMTNHCLRGDTWTYVMVTLQQQKFMYKIYLFEITHLVRYTYTTKTQEVPTSLFVGVCTNNIHQQIYVAQTKRNQVQRNQEFSIHKSK